MSLCCVGRKSRGRGESFHGQLYVARHFGEFPIGKIFFFEILFIIEINQFCCNNVSANTAKNKANTGRNFF